MNYKLLNKCSDKAWKELVQFNITNLIKIKSLKNIYKK